ncbi:type II toxin-antitoxin system VapC family toxin [soil metagenome]
MLVDTDVLIWHLRGHSGAAAKLEEIGTFDISVVTYMELVQGMRSKEELRIMQAALPDWETRILMVSERISLRAMSYVEQHLHSHALRLADALIAATAVEQGASLLTGNAKHYSMITGLTLETFRPEVDPA